MNNEAFEKWAIDYGLDYESSFTRDDVEASWQAAKADSEQEISELKSHINDLRDALNAMRDAFDIGGDVTSDENTALYKADKSIVKTPVQSLQEHDNEVIERCAKVCESSDRHRGEYFATKIIALKGLIK